MSDVSLTVDDRCDVEPPLPGAPAPAGEAAATPPRPFLPRLPAAAPKRADSVPAADLTAAPAPAPTVIPPAPTVVAAPTVVPPAPAAVTAAVTTSVAPTVLPPPLPPPSLTVPPVPVMPPLAPVPADAVPSVTPPAPLPSESPAVAAVPTTAVPGASDAPSVGATTVAEPEPVDEDLLARKAAESGDPHLIAAAQHFAQQRSAKALPQVKGRRSKRSRRKLPFLLAFAVVAGGAGMLTIGKDTTVMQRLRGDGYDPDATPGTVFARPTTGGVTYEWTTERVTVEAGAARLDTIDATVVLDLATGDRSIAAVTSMTALTDGRPGDPVTVRDLEMVEGPSGSFVRDAGGEWAAHEPGSFPADDAGAWTRIWMYQDLVDSSLRTFAPSSIRASLDGDVELTTYTWELERGTWFETAPQLLAQLWQFGEQSGDAVVEIELTVDTAGVVRELSVTSPLADTLTSLGDGDGSVGHRERWTLVELSGDAPGIVDPTVSADVTGEG